MKNFIFKLNEVESERAEKFLHKHYHPEVYKGTIGGGVEYIFIPTAIGDSIIIRCTICNEEENITDYDSW